MTIEEKLVNFEESAINAATAKRTEIVSEYEKTLKEDFELQKKALDEKAALKIKTETEELKRQANQRLSNEILNAKRITGQKAAALTDSLFEDVEKKLMEFKNAADYEALLIRQIEYALDFSDNLPMTIYIDKSDEHLVEKLQAATGATLTLSATDFVGGTRAVIHDKNILIDNSFLTRIGEVKEEFTI